MGMKEKLSLGAAAEFEPVDPAVRAAIEVAFETPEKNKESWNMPTPASLNASVVQLRRAIETALRSDKQFFILSTDEVEAVAFLTSLIDSMSNFFVNESVLASGHINIQQDNWDRDVGANARRAPNYRDDKKVAGILARFFRPENVAMMLSTLGLFIAKKNKVGGDPVLIPSIVNAESRASTEMERSFISRAIITLYHDWLGITNPVRQAEFDWVLPPMVIKNLDDLREVSDLFFKALPALRETAIVPLLNRDTVRKLVGVKTSFMTADSVTINIEQELADLIDFIYAAERPSTGNDFDMMSEMGRVRITPDRADYWNKEIFGADRCNKLAAHCSELEYNSHTLAELASWIFIFKYGIPVQILGNGFEHDILEFVGVDGPLGRGYMFGAESKMTVVEITKPNDLHHRSTSSDPLLRCYGASIAALPIGKPEVEQTPVVKPRSRIKGQWRNSPTQFRRSRQRQEHFEAWLGRPMFALGKTIL